MAKALLPNSEASTHVLKSNFLRQGRDDISSRIVENQSFSHKFYII